MKKSHSLDSLNSLFILAFANSYNEKIRNLFNLFEAGARRMESFPQGWDMHTSPAYFKC